VASGLGDEFKADVGLVEDKARGQSLIQGLERETRLPIIAVRPDHDEIARAYAVTPAIEARRVFLPESAPWLADYVDGMSSFPYAADDDDVDSTTQGLNYLIGRGSTTGLLDYYAELYRKGEGAHLARRHDALAFLAKVRRLTC